MWMKRFGFGMPTGIEIQEEATANMPSKEWKQKRYKKPWVQGDTISVGIGQGYWTATPLQVAKATSIVVNNGKIHTPHLMKSVEGATIEPYQDPLLYEDITDPKQAYWDAAKRGSVQCGEFRCRNRTKSLYRHELSCSREIRYRTSVQLKRKPKI